MANSLIHQEVPLTSFKLVIPVFRGLSVVIGICPLVALVPKMAPERQIGLREYARLGNRYTEAFDRKWVHFAEPPSELLLGTADIQSLADLDNSYAAIQQMSIAPITKMLAVQFAALAGAPLIPVVIYATPAPEIVKAILKMVA